MGQETEDKNEPEPGSGTGLAKKLPGEIGGADFDRIKRLQLTGSQPYSDRELVDRRQLICKQIDAVFREAAALGISEEDLFQPVKEAGEGDVVVKADTGSLEEASGTSGGTTTTSTAPCCTPQRIAVGLARIKAAYTAAVARVGEWKGCQDWSSIVHQAVAPVLPPCWVGKFVWRINVWPFGRWTPFDDGDTWIHHAYAVCPCTCPTFGGCPECIVLDPYTLGLSWFQTAETYQFNKWVSEGNVWRATTIADHDNCAIYRYTMQYYCRRAQTGGPVQVGACRAVRKLLMRELKRYTGATGETLERLYRDCGMAPDCC